LALLKKQPQRTKSLENINTVKLPKLHKTLKVNNNAPFKFYGQENNEKNKTDTKKLQNSQSQAQLSKITSNNESFRKLDSQNDGEKPKFN